MSPFLHYLYRLVFSRNWRLRLRLHEQIFQLEENVQQRQSSESLKVGIVIYSHELSAHKLSLDVTFVREVAGSVCLCICGVCFSFACVFTFYWRADFPEHLHGHCEKFGKQLPTRDILFLSVKKCSSKAFCSKCEECCDVSCVSCRWFIVLTSTFD